MSSDGLGDDETFKLPKSSRLKSSLKHPGQGSTRILRSQARNSSHQPKTTESPVPSSSLQQLSHRMRDPPPADPQGPPPPNEHPLPQEVPQKVEGPERLCVLNKGLPPRNFSEQSSSQAQKTPNPQTDWMPRSSSFFYLPPTDWMITPQQHSALERWNLAPPRKPAYQQARSWKKPSEKSPEPPSVQYLSQSTRRCLISSYRSDRLMLDHLKRGQKRLREQYEELDGELDENIEVHGVNDKQHKRLRRIRTRIHGLMVDLESELQDLEKKRDEEYTRVLDNLTPGLGKIDKYSGDFC